MRNDCHAFGGTRRMLIIFRKSARKIEPSKSTFNNQRLDRTWNSALDFICIEMSILMLWNSSKVFLNAPRFFVLFIQVFSSLYPMYLHFSLCDKSSGQYHAEDSRAEAYAIGILFLQYTVLILPMTFYDICFYFLTEKTSLFISIGYLSNHFRNSLPNILFPCSYFNTFSLWTQVLRTLSHHSHSSVRFLKNIQ